MLHTIFLIFMIFKLQQLTTNVNCSSLYLYLLLYSKKNFFNNCFYRIWWYNIALLGINRPLPYMALFFLKVIIIAINCTLWTLKYIFVLQIDLPMTTIFAISTSLAHSNLIGQFHFNFISPCFTSFAHCELH